MTKLIEAVYNKKTSLVEHLLKTEFKNPENINAVDSHGWSALHASVRSNQISVIKLLLQAGAEVNLSTIDGSPLFIAAEDGNVEAIKILFEAGADLNQVT